MHARRVGYMFAGLDRLRGSKTRKLGASAPQRRGLGEFIFVLAGAGILAFLLILLSSASRRMGRIFAALHLGGFGSSVLSLAAVTPAPASSAPASSVPAPSVPASSAPVAAPSAQDLKDANERLSREVAAHEATLRELEAVRWKTRSAGGRAHERAQPREGAVRDGAPGRQGARFLPRQGPALYLGLRPRGGRCRGGNARAHGRRGAPDRRARRRHRPQARGPADRGAGRTGKCLICCPKGARWCPCTSIRAMGRTETSTA